MAAKPPTNPHSPKFIVIHCHSERSEEYNNFYWTTVKLNLKTEEIKELFVQFEAAASELEGIECWSARELQTLFGYSKW